MLEYIGVLRVEDVDFLLVSVVPSVLVVGAFCLLGLALAHLIKHYYDVLLLVVDLGIFL